VFTMVTFFVPSSTITFSHAVRPRTIGEGVMEPPRTAGKERLG
jgi:hypothetical protein